MSSKRLTKTKCDWCGKKMEDDQYTKFNVLVQPFFFFKKRNHAFNAHSNKCKENLQTSPEKYAKLSSKYIVILVLIWVILFSISSIIWIFAKQYNPILGLPVFIWLIVVGIFMVIAPIYPVIMKRKNGLLFPLRGVILFLRISGIIMMILTIQGIIALLTF